MVLVEDEMGMELFTPPNQTLKLIKLRLTSKKFDEFCQYCDCVLPQKLRKVLDQNKKPMIQCGCFLPKDMDITAKNIAIGIMNNANGYFMEEMCADFFRKIVTHLYNGFSKINPKQFISYTDIERVREAHFIISQNIVNPPRLIKLAHIVGLNDYKLKRGFRQAYGMSMHEVLTDMRLTRAEKLIRENKLKVTDAAMTVGYNNLGDFSIAFKRKFGVSPRVIKSKSS